MADGKWKITIKAPFEGFAPAYWANSYPSYGRINQAGAMQNADITDPVKITQGPGLSNLTNGTQAGAVTTNLAHILNVPSSAGVSWGIGGNKLYKIATSTVTSNSDYPHTIDKSGVTGEDGKSVVYTNDFVYYFYNHSSSVGDFGRLTVSTNTFDDDFGSTVPTGASTLQNAEHPAIQAGDGNIYFGNGRYVGYYDPSSSTLSADELDLPPDTDVVDLVWEKDFLFIATNSPNLSGSNTQKGVIYSWAGAGVVSFQEPIIEVPGRLGAMIVKNGIIFIFYQDLSSTGGFKLGYINGDTVTEVASFTGSLPTFGQVCHYKGLIAFISNALVHVWGATDKNIPIALSQIADGGYATVGALSNPFGTPMVSSTDGGSNFRLAQFSGYETASNWKSLMFDVATSVVDKVKVHFEPTASGARADFVLRYNRGDSNLPLGTVSHTNESGKYHKTFSPSQECDDFRIEIDWSSGSATNPLSIRKIEIEGHLVAKE